MVIFIICILAIGTIIGIPLGIINEMAKHKIAKQTQIIQQQEYIKDQAYKAEVLKAMKNSNN